MRHRVHGRKFARTSAHRLAMRRNLVQSLIEHGEIRTTVPKAKDVRPLAERLVSLAIDGSLDARQRAEAILTDRAIIPKANQKAYEQMSDAKRDRVLRSRSGRRHRRAAVTPGIPFTAESVMHRLFATIGPAMKQRNESRGCSGGYTRLIRLSQRRLGDGSPLALLQWVGVDDKPRPKLAEKTERKRRSTAKYALYAGKPIPGRHRRSAAKPAKAAKPAAGSEPAAT